MEAATRHAARLSALDIGRGLAIVCVIYGHALAPWIHGAGDNFNQAAFLQWKFGASFMMPFFFFLSGLGWREDKSFANVLRQALTLLLIAILASAAYDFARLLISVAGLAPSLGGETLTLAGYLAALGRMVLIGDYYSLSPLWFLAALAVVRLIAAVAVRMTAAGAAVLTLLVLALSIAAIELDWRNVYQIRPLGAALLFFLAGRYGRSVLPLLERRPAAAFALVLAGAAIVALTFHLNEGCRWDAFARCGETWLEGQFGVALINGQIGNIPLFTITAFAGIGASLGLSVLLAHFGGAAARRLDGWGGNSLNLLIVNAGFLHIGNVFVERWVVPAIEPGPLFFAALLSLSLMATVLTAHMLERPLRRLHRAARYGARQLTEAIAAATLGLAWALRSDRVSQRHE